MTQGNLFTTPFASKSEEFIEQFAAGKLFKLERIVSKGHVTPVDQWYDQETHEWVVLLSGAARLRFDDESELEMKPGDFVNIAAHRRHRVEWTDVECETVWLALHYEE